MFFLCTAPCRIEFYSINLLLPLSLSRRRQSPIGKKEERERERKFQDALNGVEREKNKRKVKKPFLGKRPFLFSFRGLIFSQGAPISVFPVAPYLPGTSPSIFSFPRARISGNFSTKPGYATGKTELTTSSK